MRRAELERSEAATTLPPSYMGLVGRLHGIQVYDWADPKVREYIRAEAGLSLRFDLAYDQMYIAHSVAAIIVGEQAHFVYRMRQLAANEEARRACREHIAAVESRIFGDTQIAE